MHEPKHPQNHRIRDKLRVRYNSVNLFRVFTVLDRYKTAGDLLVDRRTKIFHVRGSDARLLVAHRPRNSHRDRNDIVTTATADS